MPEGSFLPTATKLTQMIIIEQWVINSARNQRYWSTEGLLEHQRQMQDAYVPVVPTAFENTASREVTSSLRNSIRIPYTLGLRASPMPCCPLHWWMMWT